ncbi:glycosyltransferase [Stieleria sp. JC731]|uniref:glycosyltransferase n=1 Tax=Pirellulaceae TaxID=2691357 RepID=UPI001E579ACF|nr:glycosyltransferase [Stieleria sp. JC731]MCC9601116.1 glycosyltransferase [Stieleria sp. JC731]
MSLLIDATNISSGGGGVLLRTLVQQDLDDVIVLLSENAVPTIEEQVNCDDRFVVCNPCSPLSRQRTKLLDEQLESRKFDRVLCFGNIPPLKRYPNVDVVTYFQNAHLLASLDNRTKYSIRDRIRYSMLRRAVKKLKQNTDWWAVQTPGIQIALSSSLGLSASTVEVFPFYDADALHRESTGNQSTRKEPHSFVYVSDARPHKNHKRLLTAWRSIAKEFSDAKLYLTIQKPSAPWGEAANVHYVGPLPSEHCNRLVANCEFVVFPSLLETLGLGIVEGVRLGCKAIIPNDSNFTFIVEPTDVFDPIDTKSIESSMRRVLMGESSSASQVLLPNRIGEFRDWLLR